MIIVISIVLGKFCPIIFSLREVTIQMYCRFIRYHLHTRFRPLSFIVFIVLALSFFPATFYRTPPLSF